MKMSLKKLFLLIALTTIAAFLLFPTKFSIYISAVLIFFFGVCLVMRNIQRSKN
jgi:Flp pilus assembly protein TadB